jgi:hypothetical protein
MRRTVFRFCGHRCGTAWQRFDYCHNLDLSNFSHAVNDRSVAVPTTESRKTISRTANRLAFTAVATVGLMWPGLVLIATATADPAASPGVPCMDMVQNFAAAPSAIPESLQTAASALAAPEPDAPLPPVPLTSLVEGLTAVAAPNPAPVVPPPPPVAAAPPADAAAVVPPPAPSVPLAAAPLAGLPPVPVVAGLPPAPPAPRVPVAAAPIADAAGDAPLPPAPVAPVEAAPPPPPPVAPPVEDIAPLAAAPVAEAAPASEAAAVLPAAAPPVPVVPVPAVGAIPPVPPVVVPVAPLAEAVPGFPLLPSALPLPHDFVCEGTAWSAKRNPGTGVTPHSAQLADRRDQW